MAGSPANLTGWLHEVSSSCGPADVVRDSELARAHARVLALGRRADPLRALLMIEVTTMLADSLAVTTLVVTDLDRSKKFYAEQLGLKLLEETPFTCRFGAGKGSQLSIRRGQPPVSGPTVAHFEVDDIEAQVRDLTSRGVTFDEYETPKTVNFIAQVGPARGAWFKDPDGNVIGVREGPVPAAG